MSKNLKKISKKRIFVYFLLFLLILFLLNIIFSKPSNDRIWVDYQETLSYSEINDNIISIYNIRNFTYENETEYNILYYNKDFDLDKIKKVYFIVVPFSSIKGIAHTFLSFEFENDSFISISVEIRREDDEEFSPIKGLFRNYEIMYVIGDENDLIKLRTNYQNNSGVYMYPIKTEKEKVKLLFLDVLNETNKLKESPKFYNTITSSCASSILYHVNKLRDEKILYSWKVLFPEYSGEIVYNNGYVETDLSFEEAKEYFKIDALANKYSSHNEFSLGIRKYEENLIE